jgi:hypothetical protein
MVALIPLSFAFALLALLGPALAAAMVTMVADGWRGVADLLRRLTVWRVGVVWYVLGIGVPLLVAVVVQVLHLMTLGGPVGMAVSTPVPLMVILALLNGHFASWCRSAATEVTALTGARWSIPFVR